jgi:hypothetical protein
MPQAKEAFLEGDVRTNVFLSLCGVPPDRVPERLGVKGES